MSEATTGTALPEDRSESGRSATNSASALVLSEKEETAKHIENFLRNAGHAIRTLWVRDREDLEDMIRRTHIDVVLSGDDVKDPSLKDVCVLCARLDPDLPVLSLAAKRPSPAQCAERIAAGALDVVVHAKAELPLLSNACRREIAAHLRSRELHRNRKRLAEYEDRHTKLVAGTADAIVHVAEGIVTHANAAFSALLGRGDPADVIGHPFLDFARNDQKPMLKAQMKEALKNETSGDDTQPLTLQHTDGQVLELNAKVTHGQEGGDQVLEMLIHAPSKSGSAAKPDDEDMTEEQEEALSKTGARATSSDGGRLSAFRYVTDITAAREAGAPAVLLLSVDEYDAIEDRVGMQDMERVEVQLLELVQGLMAVGDRIFRFSTEEYALVGRRDTIPELEKLAKVLCTAIAEKLFKTDEHECRLTTSIACYPLSDKEAPAKSLEAAVREARQLGRKGGNTSLLCGPLARSAKEEQEEQHQADQVQDALKNDRLKLAFQSIASLEGDSRFQYDVLVRLLGENGDEIQAREFIPAAEKHGLIVDVDRSVIRSSLRVLAAKRRSQEGQSTLFVRISEQTLSEGEAFCKWFAEQVRKREIEKGELVISIQEQMIVSHIAKSKSLCKALGILGANVAIDHFGISRDAAKLLDEIPASFVRFHFSFTQDFNDEKVQHKFMSLAEAAKRRGIKTIAGHVEDANIMARLWQMGVNYIQGYHVQEPDAALQAMDLRAQN